MAMTPEKKVKDAVTKILKAYNAYYFFPATGGFGRSGVPDIIACYNGRFIGIECKAGTNKTTALQDRELAKIDEAGGHPMIINETNIHVVKETLDSLKQDPLCDVCGKSLETTKECAWTSCPLNWDEKRVDIIGQNGPTGEHYEEIE